MKNWSDDKLDKVVNRSSEYDKGQYLEEAWENMSEAERKRYWDFLDNDLNIHSPKNKAMQRKAFRRYMRKKGAR